MAAMTADDPYVMKDRQTRLSFEDVNCLDVNLLA